MLPLRNIVFFKDATETGTSAIQYNAKGENLSVQVSGTGNYTVFIEGRVDIESEGWFSIAAINLSNLEVVKSGIEESGIYTIAIDSVAEIRARIESVSGTVTVFGRMIGGAN